MSKVLLPCAQDTTTAAATTLFLPVGTGGNLGTNTVEANAQKTMRTPGVYSNMYIGIISNATTSNSTFQFRKNTANGSQLITIGAGATGDFADTTNTDTIAAGDIIDYQLITGATSTLRWAFISNLFDASDSSTTANLHANAALTTATASTNYHPAISGQLVADTVEASNQVRNKSPAMWKNLYVHVSANARTSNTTVLNRINTANGAMLATIGSGATGVFEDSSNSNTLAVGDLINWRVTTGINAGSITIDTVSGDYVTKNGFGYYGMATNAGGGSLAAAATSSRSIAGTMQSGTDSTKRILMNYPVTMRNMQCVVIANGITANTTIQSQVSGTLANLLITIGSGATGYFEDVTHTDNLPSTGRISYNLVGGATGTTMTLGFIGINSEFVTLDKFVPDFPDIVRKAKPNVPVGSFAYPFGIVTDEVPLMKWEPEFPDIVRKAKPNVPVGYFAYPYGIFTGEVIYIDKWVPDYPDIVRKFRPLVPVGHFAYPYAIVTKEIIYPDKWLPRFPDRVWKFKPLVPTGHFSYPFGFVTGELIYPDKWTPRYPDYIWKPRRLLPGLQIITKPTFIQSVQIFYFSPDDLFNFFAT